MDATKFVNKGIFRATDELPKTNVRVTEVRETSFADGKKKLVMGVEGSDFDFVVNRGSIDQWIKRYGPETDAWVGKLARVFKEDIYIQAENLTTTSVRIVPA